MSSTEIVATYFDATLQQNRDTARRQVRLRLAFAVALVALAAILFISFTRDVMHAWLTTDWSLPSGFDTLQVYVVVLGAYGYITRTPGPDRQLADEVEELRRVAEIGAPVDGADDLNDTDAVVQPEKSSREEPLTGPLHLPLLRRSAEGSTLSRTLGIAWLVLALGVAVIALLDALGVPRINPATVSRHNFYDTALFATIAALTVLATALAFLRRAALASRRMKIVADAWGERWRDARSRTEHSLAWFEVRAFVSLHPSLWKRRSSPPPLRTARRERTPRLGHSASEVAGVRRTRSLRPDDRRAHQAPLG